MNTTLPQSGEVFDFRYRIVCRLGVGSDGYVFGATELDTGKRVAIRCWIGPHAEDALAAAQKFVRTAHEARLFDNPHIVEMFAAEAGRTVNYCVMDWLEGMTLARRIARRRPSPLSDVFNIVVPCMRAVAEAHAAGIIHGEIRPGHIFVCHATKHRPAIARVCDFGRDLDSVTNIARIPNPEAYQYTTPELLEGEPLDALSDTYAFGVMLFEMLAGERPFLADSPEELARRIKEGSAKLLASISPSIPGRLAKVVERAMAVDPALRYANLGEMIDALAPFDTTSSRMYVTPPSKPRAPAPSTALALRGSAGPQVRMPPPPPMPHRRVVNHAPDLADITTTSASWELTEPVPLGHYHFELLGRITWQRAAVWCSVLMAAVVTGRYVQQTTTPDTQPATSFAAESPVDTTPPPNSGFDPITCRNGFGVLDPSCAPPISPFPELLVPVTPPPTPVRSHAPNSVIHMPPASAPRSQRALSSPSAHSTRPSNNLAAPALRTKKPTASSRHKTPVESAPKRSRNTDSSRTHDPFENLDHMRLQ